MAGQDGRDRGDGGDQHLGSSSVIPPIRALAVRAAGGPSGPQQPRHRERTATFERRSGRGDHPVRPRGLPAHPRWKDTTDQPRSHGMQHRLRTQPSCRPIVQLAATASRAAPPGRRSRDRGAVPGPGTRCHRSRHRPRKTARPGDGVSLNATPRTHPPGRGRSGTSRLCSRPGRPLSSASPQPRRNQAARSAPVRLA